MTGLDVPLDVSSERSLDSRRHDLEDALLLAGVLGEETAAAEVLAELRNSSERIQAAEARAAQLATESVDAEVETAEARCQSLVERIISRQSQESELETRIQALIEQESGWAAEKARISSRLVQRRHTYPKRLLDERNAQRVSASRNAAERLKVHQEIRRSFDVDADSTYDDAPRASESAAERAQYAAERLSQLHEGLAAADGQLASLRAIGLTRRSAGFLLWAGYLAFGGVGWFLGQGLRAVLGQPGFIGVTLSQFMQGAAGALAKLPSWQAIAVVATMPAACLLLWGAGLVVWDRLMQWFDPSWLQSNRRPKGRRAGSWYLNAWVINPSRRLGRNDYVSILAKGPLFFGLMTLVGVFALLAAFGGRSFNVGVDPWTEFLFTYLGIVVVVIGAGIGIVYLTRVLEVRAVSAPSAHWGPRQAWELWFGTIAFLVLAVVLLLNGSPPQWVALVTALFFAYLTAVVAAYGVIYRGLASDSESIRAEINYLQSKPGTDVDNTLEAGDTFLDRVEHDLEEADEQVRRIWDDETLWQLLPGSLPFVRANRRFFRTARVSDPLDRRTLSDLLPADSLLEPDLVGEVLSAGVQLEALQERLNDLKARLLSISQERRAAEAELATARSELNNLRARRSRMTVDAEVTMESLRRTWLETSLSLSNAYRLGVRFSQRVKPELA